MNENKETEIFKSTAIAYAALFRYSTDKQVSVKEIGLFDKRNLPRLFIGVIPPSYQKKLEEAGVIINQDAYYDFHPPFTMSYILRVKNGQRVKKLMCAMINGRVIFGHPTPEQQKELIRKTGVSMKTEKSTLIKESNKVFEQGKISSFQYFVTKFFKRSAQETSSKIDKIISSSAFGITVLSDKKEIFLPLFQIGSNALSSLKQGHKISFLTVENLIYIKTPFGCFEDNPQNTEPLMRRIKAFPFNRKKILECISEEEIDLPSL